MITIKDLVLIPLSIICFIVSYLLLPLTEQYQGATGYIYEYGVYFQLLQIILLLVGVMLLGVVIVHRDYEIES